MAPAATSLLNASRAQPQGTGVAVAVGDANRCNRRLSRVSESQKGVGVANRFHGSRFDGRFNGFHFGVGVGVGKVAQVNVLRCSPSATHTPNWYPVMIPAILTITLPGVFPSMNGTTPIGYSQPYGFLSGGR
jgi:hypothetical protein